MWRAPTSVVTAATDSGSSSTRVADGVRATSPSRARSAGWGSGSSAR